MKNLMWSRLLIIGLWSTATVVPGVHLAVLPQCSQVKVVSAEMTQENLDTAEVFIETSISTQLNLDQTVCLKVTLRDEPKVNITDAEAIQAYDTLYSGGTNGSFSAYQHIPTAPRNRSLLYAFKFAQLEQSYPVKMRYEFGIPKIESSCTCDCPGGDDHCPVRFRYQNCSKPDLCVRTHHANQVAKGCPSGNEAELCCEISMRPQGAKRFHALYLGQPVTTVSLRLTTYHINNDGRSTDVSVVKDQDYQVLMSQSQTVRSEDSMRLSVQLDGTQLRLAEGLQYFSPIGLGESPIFTGLPLNEYQEWSLGKLGWFRTDPNNVNRWTVKNANIKFQAAHHSTVEDCKAQTYTDTYDAEFYNLDPEFVTDTLAGSITSYYSWIRSASYKPNGGDADRQVTVVCSTGPSVSITVELKDRPQISLAYHQSMMADFEGSIELDRYSNRFLNVTFIGARGTVVGAVYRSSNRFAIDSVLSAVVDSPGPTVANMTLLLPPGVNGTRWVCFYPSARPELEKCRWLTYHSTPLLWFVAPTLDWTPRKGDCLTCNQFVMSDFLKYLNPATWLNGIGSTSEAVAMAVEVIFYLIIVIVAISICRRCIWPAIHWGICAGSKSKPKS